MAKRKTPMMGVFHKAAGKNRDFSQYWGQERIPERKPDMIILEPQDRKSRLAEPKSIVAVAKAGHPLSSECHASGALPPPPTGTHRAWRSSEHPL